MKREARARALNILGHESAFRTNQAKEFERQGQGTDVEAMFNRERARNVAADAAVLNEVMELVLKEPIDE